MNSAHKIRFAGQELVLNAHGSLYWPTERMLVVSDLHFEKASFLAQFGSPLAPYDTLDTLERLEGLLSHYQPQELVLLGDSFHDRNAWFRLDPSLRERLQQITRQVTHCRWIEGNRDVSLQHAAEDLPRFEEQFTRHGILFSHAYQTTPHPQIIGHYHPKTSIALKGMKVRGRCFACSPKLMVMPAFGSFTGGLEVQHTDFQALFNNERIQTFLLYNYKIYPTV